MRVVIDDVSVMAAYFDVLCVCIVHRAEGYCAVCRHNTGNINIDTHIVTRYVNLAKRWMWLPDDGFYVNRNVLEQLL